jgi:hypothetical protein
MTITEPGKTEVTLPSAVLIQATSDYGAFLAANPKAKLVETDLADGKKLVIATPWGDASLVLVVPPADTLLQEALNNVFLPERFTAIWHRDTKDLEIIWSAYPLNPAWEEVPGRKFDFKFGNKTYVCAFDESSDRLVAIGSSYRPLTASATNFRNLESYRTHATLTARHASDPKRHPPRIRALYLSGSGESNGTRMRSCCWRIISIFI